MEGRIPRRLAHDIEKNISDGVEIECKIRFPDSNQETLDSIIHFFDQKDDWKKKNSYTVDIFRKNKRFTRIEDRYFNTTKSSPSLMDIVDFEDFDLKFSVAKEKFSETNEPKTYDFIRIKDRTTFTKGNINVDLTKVSSEDEQDMCYEVEVEVIHSDRFNYKEFIDAIMLVVKTQTGTTNDIISFFNKSMGGSPNDKSLNWNLIARPRDLLYPDLTNDGLLDHYAITIKADGVMKFLVFHSSGIWFLSFSKNVDSNHLMIAPLEKYTHLENSIYQGELIGNNFYPFDCCMSKMKNIRSKNYLERVEELKEIHSLTIGNINIVEMKVYPYEKNTSQFFDQTGKIFEDIKNVNYPTDGIVFHPIYEDYLPSGQKQKKTDRVLSRFKDICKFKEVENQTVDFEVKDGELYSARNILFKGTPEFPFTKQNYSLDYHTSLEGKIVEFKPYKEGENFVYKPIRIRDDKNAPNSIEVAIENWNIVRDPITVDILTGKDTKMLGLYHSHIQKKMISNMSGYVIDVFSDGKYLDDYNKNQNIVQEIFVDDKPFDLEKCDKLECSRGWSNILQKSKEILPPTIGDKNLNINFFGSLDDPHDWSKGLEEISQLYEKRDGSGKIIVNFFCINGNKLKSLFSVRKTNEIHYRNICFRKLDNTSFQIDGKLKRFIDLEHFFDQNDLEIKTVEVPKGNKNSDPILTRDERIVSQLYHYGSAVMGRDSVNESKKPDQRLSVDTTKGTRTMSGTTALGDDKLEKTPWIHPKIYRLGTIDDGKSIEHSVMKLLNGEYRGSSLEKRQNMISEISFPDSLDDLSKIIKHGIVVHDYNKDEKETYGSGKRWILLYRNKDGSYEPLVHQEKEGSKIDMVFSKDSPLLK